MPTTLAYSKKDAAEAAGVSLDTITRAINAGDLATCDPRVDGKSIQKILILRTELERWLTNGQRGA